MQVGDNALHDGCNHWGAHSIPNLAVEPPHPLPCQGGSFPREVEQIGLRIRVGVGVGLGFG